MTQLTSIDRWPDQSIRYYRVVLSGQCVINFLDIHTLCSLSHKMSSDPRWDHKTSGHKNLDFWCNFKISRVFPHIKQASLDQLRASPDLEKRCKAWISLWNRRSLLNHDLNTYTYIPLYPTILSPS